MSEPQKYYVEFFVRDFHGVRTSCGKFETHVENYTLCVDVPQELALSNLVSQFEIEFSGKVPE